MSASPPSEPDYPPGVPSKFTPDGQIQPFAGNTIVCHLPATSPLYHAMEALYAALAASPLAPRLALLPPASWHMTVLEGACDQVRRRPFWPLDLPLDAPLAQCTEFLRGRLRGVDLGAGEPPYRMRVTGHDPLVVGVGLHVVPVSAAEEMRFRGMRDRLGEAVGMRFPGHEIYVLHLTMAYLLRRLTAEQERELSGLIKRFSDQVNVEFELGRPEYCTFENMARFDRVMYVGGQVGGAEEA